MGGGEEQSEIFAESFERYRECVCGCGCCWQYEVLKECSAEDRFLGF